MYCWISSWMMAALYIFFLLYLSPANFYICKIIKRLNSSKPKKNVRQIKSPHLSSLCLSLVHCQNVRFKSHFQHESSISYTILSIKNNLIPHKDSAFATLIMTPYVEEQNEVFWGDFQLPSSVSALAAYFSFHLEKRTFRLVYNYQASRKPHRLYIKKLKIL